MKKVTRTERVDIDKYVNPETGETLESELKDGVRLIKEVPTDNVVLTFKDFVSSDAKIEEYVCSTLRPLDYQRFRHIACWLHTDFNIVISANNRPHTLQTLSKAFGISVDETTRLIRRLEAIGLAVWSFYPDSGHDKKILMLNPYYIRKRKQVKKQLLELFPDFRNIEIPVTSSKKKAPKKQPVIME